jgi:hypothetical protein
VVFTRKQTLGGYQYFLWTLVNPVKHHSATCAKDKDILVSLRGGKLLIGVKAEDGVFMVGDAEFVFEGQIKI